MSHRVAASRKAAQSGRWFPSHSLVLLQGLDLADVHPVETEATLLRSALREDWRSSWWSYRRQLRGRLRYDTSQLRYNISNQTASSPTHQAARERADGAIGKKDTKRRGEAKGQRSENSGELHREIRGNGRNRKRAESTRDSRGRKVWFVQKQKWAWIEELLEVVSKAGEEEEIALP